MTEKTFARAQPEIQIRSCWINEPLFVLLGYLLLGLLVAVPQLFVVRISLAIALALFGSGLSLVATLFPRRIDLAAFERIALSAGLSLALGGMLGFILIRSPWGLRLQPFLIVTALFNLFCYAIVLVRRRGLDKSEQLVLSFHPIRAVRQWKKEGKGSLLATILLFSLLAWGAWTFYQAALAPPSEPAMTSFYLVDQDGQISGYPDTARAGEILPFRFGIVHEHMEPAHYQVVALLGDRVLGGSEDIWLEPGQSWEEQIVIYFPEDVSGPAKIEFLLLQQQAVQRTLHLWLEIENDEPQVRESNG